VPKPLLSELISFVQAHSKPQPVPLIPEIVTFQGKEFTQIWETAARELNGWEPSPFWAFPWCGGQALARYVLDHPEVVRGKRVFDFATGSGLVAIAAERAGAASVTAADLDPISEAAVQLNAGLNGASITFRGGDAIGDALDGFELVLAGDIFYERRLAGEGMRWFRTLIDRGVQVLVGDPGRIYSTDEALTDRASYDVPTTTAIEQQPVRRTWVREVVKT
jgi:predicted nicotinamide N-methyase